MGCYLNKQTKETSHAMAKNTYHMEWQRECEFFSEHVGTKNERTGKKRREKRITIRYDDDEEVK